MPLTKPLHEVNQTSPNSRLLTDRFRLPLEQAVSGYFRRPWRVTTFSDMHDFASHPSAILSDGEIAVFVKLSEAAHGLDQFEVELAGLQYLAERAGVQIPSPIGIVPVEGGVMLVLEGVEAVERTPVCWREIGHTLARIHLVKGEQWGFEKHGYFGPLYQDNRPASDWLTFYTERRLWPRLMGAIDSGNMPTSAIRQVERFIIRLPRLNLPAGEPRLLHGDAQQNNFISTRAGAVVIDPAVHYGNPEMDLAYVDYFQAVPEDVSLGYQEILPIDPGFGERRDAWRVAALLAAVEVEGAIHLEKLLNAVQRYL